MTDDKKKSFQSLRLILPNTENFSIEDAGKRIDREMQRLFREKMKDNLSKGHSTISKTAEDTQKLFLKEIANSTSESPLQKELKNLMEDYKKTRFNSAKLALASMGILGAGTLAYKALKDD